MWESSDRELEDEAVRERNEEEEQDELEHQRKESAMSAERVEKLSRDLVARLAGARNVAEQLKQALEATDSRVAPVCVVEASMCLMNLDLQGVDDEHLEESSGELAEALLGTVRYLRNVEARWRHASRVAEAR